MTATEKRRFIEDLTATIRETLIDRIDRMPAEWDGHELREYVADKTRDMACFGSMPRGRKMRYRNEVIVRNL